MINCKLINNTQPLHLSKYHDNEYKIYATGYYIQKFEEAIKDNKEFVATFRLDPVIHQLQDGDFIELMLHTPGISPTPGLISLKYDTIEDFLRDWEILGIYDITEQLEDNKEKEVIDINNYKEIEERIN